MNALYPVAGGGYSVEEKNDYFASARRERGGKTEGKRDMIWHAPDPYPLTASPLFFNPPPILTTSCPILSSPTHLPVLLAYLLLRAIEELMHSQKQPSGVLLCELPESEYGIF